MPENWFKKLWKLMFDDEYEKNASVPRQVIRHGRISGNERKGVAKVRHQYPASGHFRFPLIPDDIERMERKTKTADSIRDRRPSITRTPQPEREKFTGKNFKASDVPSPVYGFRKRVLQSQKEPEKKEMIESADNGSEKLDLMDDSDEIKANLAEIDHETSRDNGRLIEDHEKENDVKDEVKSIQKVHQSADRENRQETNRLTQEKGTEKRASTYVLPERKPSVIPYNVMMFSSDQTNGYRLPKLFLLNMPEHKQGVENGRLVEQKKLLNETLKNFNVDASVTNVVKGPTVTRFEVQPSPGVKVNKITNLSDDIKLSLSAKEIRIEAPIPGKNAIGIEVPNHHWQPVCLREVLESRSFQTHASPLAVALGVDISGQPVVTDLKKMPHGLIAGATGSGKSVCINSILISLLFKTDPNDVKFLLIDPKVVELAPYNELPHLVTPVVTDAKEATLALKWVVEEMERRYRTFAEARVRDIDKYNEAVRKRRVVGEKLPYLVIVIDELADLMMVSPQEVEDAICRIAQKARASGIHLLVATQRPSVDVITGLIKANIPTRIAFSVSSQADSRTILDIGGAEKLLGRGDMLFLENGSAKPVRLQGNFVSDEEIERVTSHIKKQRQPHYLIENDDLVSFSSEEQEDELFYNACDFVFEQGAASSSSLQRRFRIGYNRAARLLDMMEECGLVSKANGSKPRKVLLTKQEFYEKHKHAGHAK